jgi:hypothetical protein
MLLDASVRTNLEAVPAARLTVPATVVVTPDLPRFKADVFVPPIVMVPFAVTPKPVSIDMFPLVPEVAVSPVRMVIAPELPEAPAAVLSVKPFALPVVVMVPLLAKVAEVPMVGVVIVGDVSNTTRPEPVSSEREEAREEEAPVAVNSPPVVVKSARSAVREEKVTVEDASKVVVLTPVAPVIAPAPVIDIDGLDRKFVKPVPNVIALKVLFV